MKNIILFIAGCGVVGLPAPETLANRFGAPGGWNGSTASGGSANNCMTCHGAVPGAGSVQILNTPEQYTLGQLYELAVRVSDSAQLGAGFQFSAEDSIGNHVGSLILVDATLTREAPVKPEWVTHTTAGVQESVDNWSQRGFSVEYRVNWQAPNVDVGPVTFWAAGNAINNDFQAFNDSEHVYLTNKTAQPQDTCLDGMENNGEQGLDCGGPCPPCACLADNDCDDADACTLDQCQTNVCLHSEIAACCRVDTDCDDSDDCTEDRCEANVCNSEFVIGCCLTVRECDDGNPCTDDDCSNERCVNEDIAACCTKDAQCDDGNACTEDACVNNACEHAGVSPCCTSNAECNDFNPCTNDVCAQDVCVFSNGSGVCDDGDPCTINDACRDGSCVGEIDESCCTADESCDDNDACTADACVENECLHELLAECVPCIDDDECDDGLFCTEDLCLDGACVNDDLEGCDEPVDGTGNEEEPADDVESEDETVDDVESEDDNNEDEPGGSDEVEPGPPDADDDGITDDNDACRSTPAGEIVDGDGCSESQLGNEPVGDEQPGDVDGEGGAGAPIPEDADEMQSPRRPQGLCGAFGMLPFAAMTWGLGSMHRRRARRRTGKHGS